MSDDDVLVRVGPFPGNQVPSGSASVYDLAGWTSVRVQRSCEAFPSVFEVVTTERFPGDLRAVPVKPGDPVQIRFTHGAGSEPVVTGFVDRVVPAISASQHSVTLIGRAKGQDLVDCSHASPTGQFNNMSVQTIARELAKPFAATVGGIKVSQVSGDDRVIPQLVAQYTESPYELIERVARFAALLVYDDPNGDVVLARVGTDEMGSAIVEGKNVIQASIAYSMDQRFSDYRFRRFTFDTLRDTAHLPEGDIIEELPDPGVPRFRPKTVIVETPAGLGLDYAKQRGAWEVSRRYGRSSAIHVTVDSWRDGKGRLWSPNSLVKVELPSLKRGGFDGTKWVIATAVFRRDERGTLADLVIMPAEAFDVLPVPLGPLITAGPFIDQAAGPVGSRGLPNLRGRV